MSIFDRAKSARPRDELVKLEGLARTHPDPEARRRINRELNRQAELVVDEVYAEIAEQDQHRRRGGQ